jgi:hypothetical protein
MVEEGRASDGGRDHAEPGYLTNLRLLSEICWLIDVFWPGTRSFGQVLPWYPAREITSEQDAEALPRHADAMRQKEFLK